VTAPFGPPLLITNPLAGSGRGEVLRTVSAALEEQGLEHDVVETTAAGDATRIAREAVAEGRRFVVAVGGDGTVHEVVNGLVDAETGQAHAEGVVLGIIPGGRAATSPGPSASTGGPRSPRATSSATPSTASTSDGCA
jgi:diacylglycerol kinase (ATP)